MENKSLFAIMFLFLVLSSAPDWSAVNTHVAKDCTQIEVQKAIDLAQDGDTVLVPAGTAVWDTYVAISKPLSIIGSGNTTLTATQKMPGGFFRVQNLTTTDLLRISSFKIVMLPYYYSVGGTDIGIFIHYNCPLIQQLRIDHNTFVFGSAAIQIYDSKGVVDHNIDYNSHRFISYNGWNGTAAQAATWVDLTAGTDDPLFFEDNTQIIDANYPAGDTYGQFIDTANGGKIVLRYNTMNADSAPDINKQVMMIHGNNTGGNSPDHSYWQQGYPGVSRGQSVVEWYNNDIHGTEIVEAIILRGSTNLVYNNIFTSNILPKIYITDNEGDAGSTFSPRRMDWPAEDQVHNTFVWGNTFNGVAQTGTASDEQYINKGTGGYLVQLNRDYVYHAPQASGGREYFTGLNGASSAYPTDGIKYPTRGNMVFTPNGPNAHYPYIPFVYPHPLTVQGENGRRLDLQAIPNGSSLALSWQTIIGVVSYRVVRDWQEAQAVIVTGTNWTDTAPTGEHVYMVYALDNAGKVLAAEGKLGIRQQVLTLASGWNWISFNVLPGDLSLNSVFTNILAQVEQVKTQTQSAIRISNAWKGDLADMAGIRHYKMYKVKVNAACTLTVTGTTITPTTPIPLQTGWNWVTYLPTTAMPITTALDSIKGQVLQIKSLTQSAIYNGTSWSSTFDMQPGQGYAIKMSAPGTLTYPAGK